MRRIPIKAARDIADQYDYDQVIIYGRNLKDGEHMTTYGRSRAYCNAAAKIGDALKRIIWQS